MIELTPVEARIIGALIEKEITTPDQYPLSLKGLTVACNQKSNREPVMDLQEVDVQNVIDDLVGKNLVSQVVLGSRVTKFKHRFCNTEFSKLHLNKRELGVICVMLLRGPQTPGELRSRTNRLCEFTDVSQVESVLQTLSEREDGPFVVRLEREPGKRESRYAHTFCGEVVVTEVISNVSEINTSSSTQERIEALENEVAGLRAEVEALKQQWQELME